MEIQKSIELLPTAKFIFVLLSQKTKISVNHQWSHGERHPVGNELCTRWAEVSKYPWTPPGQEEVGPAETESPMESSGMWHRVPWQVL